MVGLQGVREGRVCDGEEEHAAAEHLGGGEICAVGGGRERAAGVSQSRTSTSCLIRQRERGPVWLETRRICLIKSVV